MRVSPLASIDREALRDRDTRLKSRPTPIERPYRVRGDQVCHDKRDRVRQAQSSVASLQCSRVVGDADPYRNRLAPLNEVPRRRKLPASRTGRSDEDLRPRRSGEYQVIVVRVSQRTAGSIVVGVIRRECRNRYARVKNDQSRHSARSASR